MHTTASKRPIRELVNKSYKKAMPVNCSIDHAVNNNGPMQSTETKKTCPIERISQPSKVLESTDRCKIQPASSTTITTSDSVTVKMPARNRPAYPRHWPTAKLNKQRGTPPVNLTRTSVARFYVAWTIPRIIQIDDKSAVMAAY